MSSPAPSLSVRSRRWHLSNGRQAWQERLGLFALVAAGAAACWLGGRFGRSQQILLWALLAVGLVVVSRRGWVKLFGPLLFYELVRLARRGRYALLRCLYALFLLWMLYLVYTNYIERAALRNGGQLQAREMAALGASFFMVFMVTQFLTVGLLTPAYVAGAVCEDKESKTLGFLLATDLRNREIVLSKLASRLGNLCLLVLTGLPILSLTEFLGGVDPDLVLASFAATALTMLSAGSLSILCSVYSRKTAVAVISSYMFMAFYVAGSSLLMILMLAKPGVAGYQLPLTTLTLSDCVNWVNAGNLIFALFELARGLGRGLPIADVFPDVLRNYALFHALVALVCCTVAIVRLRAVFLREVSGPRRKRMRTSWRWRRRPPVSDRPMLWKEMFGGLRLSADWPGRIALGLMVGGSFAPAIWIGYYVYFEPLVIDNELPAWMNAYVRGVGTIVACGCLLGIALRASGSVTGERERQTWESVLITPLECHAILFGKWLGSILTLRWAVPWLAAIWTLGILTGGLSVLAVPLLAAACLVYAGFLSSLGLCFSMISRSSLRANVRTMLLTALLAGGYWLFLFWIFFDPERFSVDFRWFVGAAFTPPLSLGMLAFTTNELQTDVGGIQKRIIFVLIGLVVWAAGAAFLWYLASSRFRSMRENKPEPSLALRVGVAVNSGAMNASSSLN
jgi:ABC-type transport system involved in multi-copper enzyme maturation permease subunit